MPRKGDHHYCYFLSTVTSVIVSFCSVPRGTEGSTLQNQPRPIDQLDAQKAALLERIKALEERHRELKATNRQRIAALTKEADRLAAIFRPMVQQSNEAYAAGQKEEAHEIAVERQRITAQSDALNKQANDLRDELANMPSVIAAARQELAALNARLTRLKPLRHIAIDGFEQARGVSAQVVTEELLPLAPRLLRHIKRVTYEDKGQKDFAVGRTGSKAENPEQTTITLYPTFLAIGLEAMELEKEYRDTIVHEVGHVLFEWILTPPQRFEWGELYNNTRRKGGRFLNEKAGESLREDFGECFNEYIHRPANLLEYDEERYNLIDTAYKEVSK